MLLHSPNLCHLLSLESATVYKRPFVADLVIRLLNLAVKFYPVKFIMVNLDNFNSKSKTITTKT